MYLLFPERPAFSCAPSQFGSDSGLELAASAVAAALALLQVKEEVFAAGGLGELFARLMRLHPRPAPLLPPNRSAALLVVDRAMDVASCLVSSDHPLDCL
jgi:hypothetical protein